MDTKLDLSQYFEPYVISCHGYDERLKQFKDRADELGVSGYRVHVGVDGRKIDVPNWWRSTGTKFACLLAHLSVMHAGLSRGEKSILIFEDDAYLHDNFVERVFDAVRYFEEDEQATVLYLGGSKRSRGGGLLDNQITRPARVVGTWAYAMTQDYARKASGFLLDHTPPDGKVKWQFNDIRFANRGLAQGHAIMTPPCVGHRGGFSVIHGTNKRPQSSPRDQVSRGPSTDSG